jgi:hypothetical protein
MTTESIPLFIKENVEHALSVMVSPDDVFEIRILDAKIRNEGYVQKTMVGYFDNIKCVVPALIDSKITSASGIYLTMNPVMKALIARCQNKIMRAKSGDSTADKYIVSRRWLLIDTDPIRPAGISSSNEEKKLAQNLAKEVKEYLSLIGWPEPVIADSGNGYHLLYRIDLPPESEIVKFVLESLSNKFSNEQVKVDVANHNPSRIVKLYGTKAGKGDHCPALNRPHRISMVISAPDIVSVVPMDLIDKIIDTRPVAQPSTPDAKQKTKNDNNGQKDQANIARIQSFIDKYLQHCNPKQPQPYEGGLKWRLDICPFNPDHSNTSAAIFCLNDGRYGFNCQHDGCKDKEWKDLKQLFIKSTDGSISKWDQYKGGRYFPSYNNALMFLEQNEIDLKYNDFGHFIEIDGKRYNDNDTIIIKEKMRGMRLEMSVTTIDEAVLTVALRNRYHPVKQYIESLEWDGTPRAETWLHDMAGAKDDCYTRFISRTVLLSAIYRVYQPGCQYDTMIIFEGDQGIGKSKIVRALGGKWYKSITLTDRDKDTIQLMQGAWFIEVPELSVFAKRDIESLKAFISNPTDSARFAYGRNDRVYPRQSVFVGTINPEANGYLMDSTGNRRFLPIQLRNIKYDLIEKVVNQLFAETYLLYKQNVSIYISDKKMLNISMKHQTKREFHDDWGDQIVNWIRNNKLDVGTTMTTCDIYHKVLGGQIQHYDQRIGRRIGNILRKIGCGEPKLSKINGLVGKYFNISKLIKNTNLQWTE